MRHDQGTLSEKKGSLSHEEQTGVSQADKEEMYSQHREQHHSVSAPGMVFIGACVLMEKDSNNF